MPYKPLFTGDTQPANTPAKKLGGYQPLFANTGENKPAIVEPVAPISNPTPKPVKEQGNFSKWIDYFKNKWKDVTEPEPTMVFTVGKDDTAKPEEKVTRASYASKLGAYALSKGETVIPPSDKIIKYQDKYYAPTVKTEDGRYLESASKGLQQKANLDVSLQKQRDLNEAVKKNIREDADNFLVQQAIRTFIPTRMLDYATSGSYKKEMKDEVFDELAQEHPFQYFIGSMSGEIGNLLLFKQLGAGFNLGEKVNKAAAGTRSLYPTATRIAGMSAEGASIFGIKEFFSSFVDEMASGNFSYGNIAANTAKGTLTGALVSSAGGFGTLTKRVTAGGTIFGGITAIETLIKEKKIKASDIPDILVSAFVGMLFELAGGTKKTNIFRGKEIANMQEDMLVANILIRNPKLSRAEAERLSMALNALPRSMVNQFNVKQQTQLVKILDRVPESFIKSKTVPAETKVKYMNRISENIYKNNLTIEQAVLKTNIEFGLEKGEDEPVPTTPAVDKLTQNVEANLPQTKTTGYKPLFATQETITEQAEPTQPVVMGIDTVQKSNESAPITVTTKTGDSLIPKKIELIADADVNNPDDPKYKMAEMQAIIMAEIENARASSNIKYEDETYGRSPSTFPAWIPEEFRRSNIVQPVLDHLRNGTLPTISVQARFYNYLAELFESSVEERATIEKELDLDKINFNDDGAFKTVIEDIDNQIKFYETNSKIYDEQTQQTERSEAPRPPASLTSSKTKSAKTKSKSQHQELTAIKKEQEVKGRTKILKKNIDSLESKPTPSGLTKSNKSDSIKQKYDSNKPNNLRSNAGQKELSETSEVGRTRQNRTQGTAQIDRQSVPQRKHYIGNSDVRKRFRNAVELNNEVRRLLGERQSTSASSYTDEEKLILSLYSGSGGLERQGESGRGLLDEYYTPYKVAKFVWEKIGEHISLNKNGYSVLEPAMGTGVFVSASPLDIKKNNFVGYELSKESSYISQILFPEVVVNGQKSFESLFVDEFGAKKKFSPSYHIIVGNPPYGKHRGKYLGLGEESKISSYEDYFIKRSLDLTVDGGIVAMVVPSGFLRNGTSYAKEQIAKNAVLIDAYRLPNGTFSTTDMGTDIVIFKKGETSTKPLLTDDNYFKENPAKVLGEEKERKGKFGMEKYVEGSLDDLIIETDQLEEQSELESEGIPANEFKEMEREADADNKEIIEQEIIEQAREDKEIDSELPTPTERFVIRIDNKSKVLKKHADVDLSEEQKQGWINTSWDGSLNKIFADQLTNQQKLDNYGYYKGKWYLNFNYAAGNIYEKLETLETEKSSLTKQQYEKQKALLESVIPEPSTVKEINIDVRSPFVAKFKIGETNLKTAFRDFLIEEMPREAFGDLTRLDVTGYIDGDSVRGNDKDRNKYVRDNRGRVANEMFKQYIQNNLPDDIQANFVKEFNALFNGFYYPDYKSVPLFTHTLKKFKNSELVLNEAQRRAIGFLITKGVGTAALDVGVGKTIASLIAIQETMARGWSKRPLIIVEKNTYKQWINTIKQLYPEATINDWSNLGTVYNKHIDDKTLRPSDGSVTLLTYQGFTRLRFKQETYDRLSGKMKDDITAPGEKTKRQEEKENQETDVTVGKVTKNTKDIYFEEMGFDHLTIDEAQNFNHIIGKSKKGGESTKDEDGESDEFKLQITPSTRGLLSWYAAQYVQEQNNNRNVYLLTATPFTNNPLEYYSILTLTSYQALKERGVDNVNDFLATFMEMDDAPMFSMSGDFKVGRQIKSFKNAKELKSLLNENMLFIDGEEAGVIRPDKITKQHILKRTSLQEQVITEINDQIKRLGNKRENAGKKLALFGKIIQSTLTPYATDIYEQFGEERVTPELFVENSPKIKAMMDIIAENKKSNKNANQIIYCPYVKSTDNGINYHSLMKEYLVKNLKYKNNEVGIINGATKDDQRVLIQDGFNDGRVKVVIGSSAIMRGVNLQEQTTDIHVLILPWNYEDLRQLSGRAWRQGNRYANVRIRQYLMENSGDIFVSQKLAVKEARSQSLASLKGEVKNNVLDAGLITFSEALGSLVTDPVQRVEMEKIMTESEINQKLSLAISNLAFLNKKLGLEKLKEIDDEITNVERYLHSEEQDLIRTTEWANKDSYWMDRIPKIQQEVDNYKEKISKLNKKKNDVIAERERQGVDVGQIRNSEKVISDLKEKRRGLEDEFKKKMETAIEQKKSESVIASDNNYAGIAKEVIAENKKEIKFAKWFELEKINKQGGATNASIGFFSDNTPVLIGNLDKVMPVQLPEMMELAKALQIKVQLNGRLRSYAGKFTGYSGIQLKPSLFKSTEDVAKTLAHELGHAVDWLPDHDMGRGNILGRINTLHDFLKNKFGSDEITNKIYREELWQLSQKWSPVGENPSDSFLKYRKSARELYADAISVLLNSPGYLEQQAPNFYTAFFDNLDKKPEVKDVYFALQNYLHGGDDFIRGERRQRVKSMFEAADYKARELEQIRRNDHKKWRKSILFRWKKDYMNIHAPFTDRANKVANLNPDDNPVYLLNASNYVGSKIRAYFTKNIQPIYDGLNEMGIDWGYMGEVLFYERIARGDRGEIANPGGFQPEFVEDMYDDIGKIEEQAEDAETKMNSLRFELGEEKFLALKAHADMLRQSLRDLFKEGYEAGIYTSELMELVKQNAYYVPFKTQKYMDQKAKASVKHQKGTLSDIENPANTALNKTVAIIRAIERQKMKITAIRFLKNYFPEDIEDARMVYNGKTQVPVESSDPAKKLVIYMQAGKPNGVYVDEFIYDSLMKNTVGQNMAIIQTLRFVNAKWFRPVYTSLNLGFQASNLLRDFFRFWKNVPHMNFSRAIVRYVQAAPHAVNRVYSRKDDLITEMEEKQAIGITYSDIINGESEEDRQIDMIMRDVGLGLQQSQKGLVRRALARILQPISNMSDIIESIPKVAAYIELKSKNWNDKQMADYIRRKVGSPDFLAGGKYTPATNNIFLFSNAIIQAVSSDYEVATDPKTRAGFWWKTAERTFLPKLLMLLAGLGLFGKAVQEMMSGASEYDKTNYAIVPIGIDQNGKSVYLRVPEDETGRFMGGVFWKLINSNTNKQGITKDIKDIASLFGGQLPGLTPAVTIPVDTYKFLSGQNLYDDFRQRFIFTDQEMKAGGVYTAKPFGEYIFQEVGGNIFIKFYTGERKSQMTPSEKVLSLPIVSNVVGRFLKISDYGKTEDINTLQGQMEAEKAKYNLDTAEVIKKYATEARKPSGMVNVEYKMVEEILGHIPQTAAERDEAKKLRVRLKLAIKKTVNDSNARTILYASSNEIRVELLREMQKSMSKEKFRELIATLVEYKIASDSVLKLFYK